MDLITEITIFVLAAFVGFEVISKVPTTLHTPLMSQTNAIHGIVMLGGLIVVGFADDALEYVIGVDRDRLRHDQHRRRLHGHRPDARHVRAQAEAEAPTPTPEAAEAVMPSLAVLEPGGDVATLLYIVSFSLFIFGVRRGTHPTTAKQGNLIAAGGMAIAVVTTLLLDGIGNWGLIVGGLAVGTAVGVVASIRVQMTEMPQMVALYNGVGGGAVALIAWSEFRHGIALGDEIPLDELDPDPVLGGRRLGLLLGLEHRLRQAPGPDPDPAAGGPRPAGDQRAAAGRDRRRLRRASRVNNDDPSRGRSSSAS